MALWTQVRVHDGTSWQVLANASNIKLRRRAGEGEASFRVNDATIAQRDLLRTGRECEITITVGGHTKLFGGFIDRPRIQVESPGHFSIHPRVVDLSHGAAWQTVTLLRAARSTKYTDIIKQIWRYYWNQVDRSQVQDSVLTHPEPYYPGFDTLASFTSEVVDRYLPGWVWWVGHDGADASGITKKLYVQPRGHNDRTGSVTITENDVGGRFGIQPTVDPRNHVLVVGDDDPATDADRPVIGTATDTNSRDAYGLRKLVTKESDVADPDALRTVAKALLEQRKFDLWQGRFKIDNWSIEPGDKVSMHLPTVGVNNGRSGVPWILMEVEESVSRGTAQRWGTFVEHNDAAYFRQTGVSTAPTSGISTGGSTAAA